MQNPSQASSAVEMALQALDYGETQLKRALDCLGEREEVDGHHSFIELPNDSSWRSFKEAAADVRTLDVDKRYIPILGVLSTMAHAHRSSLFPNLQSLRWTARSSDDLINLSPLIVPALVNLSLELHDLPPPYLHNIYQLLTGRIFMLQCLQISLPDHIQPAPQAIQILSNLLTSYSSTLIRVQIPIIFAIPPIIHCLATMPKLSHINVGSDSALLPNLNTLNPNQYVPSNRQGYFLSLRDFSYRGPPQPLYSNFLHAYSFATVSVFNWSLEGGIDDMKVFLRFIELGCPRLKTLTLGQSTMCLSGTRRPRVVPWDAVRGLLQCRYLTSVSIYCARVDMTKRELTSLLRSRRTWKKVELYTRRPLELQDMFLYGKHCPNLTSLGMHLDAPTGNELNDHGPPFPATIPRLHELDLGHSTIDPRLSFAIGVFLYKISRRPVYVQALDHELWQRINENIVSLYEEHAAQTGRPLSAEVVEYISTVEQDMENLMDLDDLNDNE